ncbi:MAG: PHP domain-containing protein [Eubacteriales bacterium]|nr:PHP domain-containing protein [Eubacteriales bacterium]
MKFDLHCHTKEGSFDSKVPISEYVSKYKILGYDGLMITDHNSYRGCRAWHRIQHLPQYEGFTVICGIEYDTKDAGHMLVIMPDGVYLPLLKIRGMRCAKLVNVVHSHGGILGLAHPFGIASSSGMKFRLMNYDLIHNMDFVEVFNTCESEDSNRLSAELAAKYGLPGFAGTDAHSGKYIGMAATEIDREIRCNNDLIAAVLEGSELHPAGVERPETRKSKAKDHWSSQMGYKIYNRGLAKARMVHRKVVHRKLMKNNCAIQ